MRALEGNRATPYTSDGMSTVINDPYGALRAEIDRAAQRTDLSPDEQAKFLRGWRDDLVDLLGVIDTYLGDVEKVREALDPAYQETVLGLREDANIRDELLARGLATPENLDEHGYLSHVDLDKLIEEGLLDEWITQLREEGFEELKHPRGRGGKFRDVLGRVVKVKGRHGRAVPTPQHEKPSAPPGEQAERVAANESGKDKSAPNPEPHVPGSVDAHAVPSGEKVAQDGAKAHELGLDVWPVKGEAATRLLGDAADTQEKHTRVLRSSGGGRIYTPERKLLHDQIIDSLLRERMPVENNKGEMEMHPNPAGQELKPTGKTPTALFLAGGSASGKTSALGLEENKDVTPQSAVHVDPDEIKALIPEYVALVNEGDKFAAAAVHEESSDIAKRLLVEAMGRGLNVVRDGTGDSPGPKFANQIREMKRAGYEVHAFYVNAPIDVAVARSISRAQKTGRYVPIPEVRAQHKNVSARFVEHIQPLVEDGTVAKLRMFQTEGEPVLFADGEGGKFNIHDQGLFDGFTAKANE
jgi:predicted ABC-type ATPase